MTDIEKNVNSKIVVETLVQLARPLGERVVIEGIETEARFALASNIDHVDGQGYYISAPIACDRKPASRTRVPRRGTPGKLAKRYSKSTRRERHPA